MPQQLPQSLGAVDTAQASPITAPKTDTKKEGKGGERMGGIARDLVFILYSQAAKSLTTL